MSDGCITAADAASIPAGATDKLAGHTPGPWRVNAGNARIDVPDRDAPICELLWPTELRSEAETRANARLIAAAPDGLAFAQHYDAYMAANYAEVPSSSALHPTAAETWRQCRAFIAKATGAGQ